MPDFAKYAQLNERARAKIAQAERLLEDAGTTTSTTAPSGSTTTTTTEGAASA